MRPFILLLSGGLMLCSLAACMSAPKTRQDMSVYDFGLPVSGSNEQKIISKIPVQDPSAAASLNQNKMRYRLNYQNPARVFYYSESRWVSPPPELLAGRLHMMADIAKNPLHCSLKLKIEAFDHVFQTTSSSEGVVQLSALLIENNSGKVAANRLIMQSAAAPTPTAQGGVTALRQASESALKEAISWGNMAAESNTHCQ